MAQPKEKPEGKKAGVTSYRDQPSQGQGSKVEEGGDSGGGQREDSQRKLHSMVELITEGNDLRLAGLKGIMVPGAEYLRKANCDT